MKNYINDKEITKNELIRLCVRAFEEKLLINDDFK